MPVGNLLGDEQAIGASAGKAQRQRLARGGCQFVFRGVAHDLSVVAVGENHAAVFRKNVERHSRMGGEEKSVAMAPVVGPFAVDAEILDRGLDFDNLDLALFRQRHEVGAAAAGQSEFRQHGMTHFAQQPLHPAAHHERPLGLAAVDETRLGMR